MTVQSPSAPPAGEAQFFCWLVSGDHAAERLRERETERYCVRERLRENERDQENMRVTEID